MENGLYVRMAILDNLLKKPSASSAATPSATPVDTTDAVATGSTEANVAVSAEDTKIKAEETAEAINA